MKLRSLFVSTSAVVLLAAPPVAGAAPASRAPRHTIGRGTSSNWSGYAVDGSNATTVTGTWIQPTAKCAPRENSWSSPWVGIDGDTDNTVEQTGTDSDCVNGKPYYYAWYEMYPKSAVIVPLAVNPGDTITGTVSYGGSSFTLSLEDTTTGAPQFSVTQPSKKPARSSVEWIVEGPSNGLLSDFGTVAFSGASATINGHSAASLGALGAYPITMETGGAVRAAPSAISGRSAFTDTWQHS
jgi:hypothetical protein